MGGTTGALQGHLWAEKFDEITLVGAGVGGPVP